MSGPGPGQGPDQQQPPQGGWGQVPPPQQGWGQAPPPPPQGYGQVPPQQQGWTQAPPPPPGYQQPAGGFQVPPNWAPPPIAPGPAAGIQYADFVPRLIAYIIDAIILAIPQFILTTILITNSVNCSFSNNGFNCGYNWGGFLIVAVVQFALSAGYFIYTWSSMRATPGDKILGIMVLNEADGSPLSLNTAAMRWAVMALPGVAASLFSYSGQTIGILLGLVSFVYVLYLAYTSATDPKRQGFHDKFVHTVVVRAAIR